MNVKKFLFSGFLGSVVCGSALAAATVGTEAFNQDQVTQVKSIVHDYLVTNPQVLVEASEALQKQEIQQAEHKALAAIAQNAQALFASPTSPVVGNPKGDITVVEFFDYQCPHCKDMSPVLEKISANDPNLRIVYKELPIFGSTSKDAAVAAIASLQQGTDKYVKFHQALMAAPNPLTKDKVMEIAKSVGLDTNKLSNDMNSAAVRKEVDDNFKLAQVLGLMGTPTFIVGKWTAGASNVSGTVKNVGFAPGVVSGDKLKELIAQARQS